MEKKSINLVSLIRKLIREYEKKHETLYFSFIKRNNEYIYIDINDNLLELLRLKATDVIGKSLYNNQNFLGTYSDEIFNNYEKAWQGDPIFYYLTPASNTEIFLIISLDPILNENGNVNRVDAHCVQLNKSDENVLQMSLSQFKEHESISNK
ncbi:hypothetical protein KUV80_12985 [Fictibacillus nanhaiensis]|uniref:hypothetical protein n=1 Tax=Fictibacillus nanhaiensis TaxID=742169 RepID=UPI001C9474F7|nr:hypothetical protein [Fictibacillus nanhaiensis]MBY6037578.1 hypothetical protein [Fictibacillus nanhaiensis]